jgi:hypothetical protein
MACYQRSQDTLLEDYCHLGCIIPHWQLFPVLCRGNTRLGIVFADAMLCKYEDKSAEITKKLLEICAELRFFLVILHPV